MRVREIHDDPDTFVLACRAGRRLVPLRCLGRTMPPRSTCRSPSPTRTTRRAVTSAPLYPHSPSRRRGRHEVVCWQNVLHIRNQAVQEAVLTWWRLGADEFRFFAFRSTLEARSTDVRTKQTESSKRLSRKSTFPTASAEHLRRRVENSEQMFELHCGPTWPATVGRGMHTEHEQTPVTVTAVDRSSTSIKQCSVRHSQRERTFSQCHMHTRALVAWLLANRSAVNKGGSSCSCVARLGLPQRSEGKRERDDRKEKDRQQPRDSDRFRPSRLRMSSLCLHDLDHLHTVSTSPLHPILLLGDILSSSFIYLPTSEPRDRHGSTLPCAVPHSHHPHLCPSLSCFLDRLCARVFHCHGGVEGRSQRSRLWQYAWREAAAL